MVVWLSLLRGLRTFDDILLLNVDGQRQIYTGKIPYYQCGYMPYQIITAHQRGELPLRPPKEELSCDQLDDQIWKMMEQGCWRKDPEERFTCKDLCNAVGVEYIQEHQRYPHPSDEKSAFWTTMGDRSDSGINYSHIEQTIIKVGDY